MYDPWGQPAGHEEVWWKEHLLYPLIAFLIIVGITWLIYMWATTPGLPVE